MGNYKGHAVLCTGQEAGVQPQRHCVDGTATDCLDGPHHPHLWPLLLVAQQVISPTQRCQWQQPRASIQ